MADDRCQVCDRWLIDGRCRCAGPTDSGIVEDFIKEIAGMSLVDKHIALHGGVEIVCDGNNWTIERVW